MSFINEKPPSQAAFVTTSTCLEKSFRRAQGRRTPLDARRGTFLALFGLVSVFGRF